MLRKIFLIIAIAEIVASWDNQDSNYKVPFEMKDGKKVYNHNPLHKDYYDGKECVTSFECWSTGCCKDGECKESSECEKSVIIIYIVIGVCAFVVLIGVLIYTICTINESKKHVKEIKSKNKSEQQNEKKKSVNPEVKAD